MRCSAKTIAIAIVAVAVLLLGDGLWIHAKAQLAQYLIADTWRQTLASGQTTKPWPWADT